MDNLRLNSINLKKGMLKRFISGDFTKGRDNSVVEWEIVPFEGFYIELQVIKANVGKGILEGEKKLVAEIWAKVDNEGNLNENGELRIINQSVYKIMDDLAAECDVQEMVENVRVYKWVYNENIKQNEFVLSSKYGMKYRLYVSDYDSVKNDDSSYPIANEGFTREEGENVGIRVLVKGLIYKE